MRGKEDEDGNRDEDGIGGLKLSVTVKILIVVSAFWVCVYDSTMPGGRSCAGWVRDGEGGGWIHYGGVRCLVGAVRIWRD